jgi:hypothetical protein
MQTVVFYAASAWGYMAQVRKAGKIIVEYHAGNHIEDPNITLPIDIPSHNRSTSLALHKRAKWMAMELAREWIGGAETVYNSDLHEKIYSFSDE